MRFWLDMGVDGFREDVVTFIAKTPGLPNSYPWLPAINGLEHFSNLPRVHDYLMEFKKDVLDHYDCFTVGESPNTTAETALRYIAEGPDQVLDEMIAFSHMEADCILTDMIPRPFSLRKLKRAMSDWQEKLEGKAWNALYIENHDQSPKRNSQRSARFWRPHWKSRGLAAASRTGTGCSHCISMQPNAFR